VSAEEKQEHRWVKKSGFKWSVCLRCDLVALKNKVTEKAITKPCIGQYINVSIPEHLKTKIP
jgi:hypothetical protein